MPSHGSRSTYTRERSPRRSARPITVSWRWCLSRGGRNFQHPRRVQRWKQKKVRIAPAPSSAPSKEDLDFATCHKPFLFFRFMAGTTGLEPATSAVTVSLKPVTYRNAGQWVAPIGPKRHTEESLLCPSCALKFPF